MIFKSLVEQAKRRKFHGGGEDKIAFSMRKSGRTTAISFSIGPRLVTDAGFIKGDKIDLLWDSDDEIGIIRRDNEKGKKFTMSPSGRIHFQITWSEGMPTPQDGQRIILSGTETQHGEIVFDLPTHKDTVLDNVSEISVSR